MNNKNATPITTLRIEPHSEGIAIAARLLREGRIVAFPTETVYGLGADATNAHAVAHIFAAKGRPHFNPLITHVAEVSEAFALGEFSRVAQKLAKALWPGPLTLVVPIKDHCPVCDLARAGLMSIAIRVPAHPITREILRATQRPIVAPSANLSGHISPTRAVHVLDDLDGKIDAIMEGGDAPIGLESTILACLGEDITLLRSGAITRMDIKNVTGLNVFDAQEDDTGAPKAPGQLASHYAPHARLRLEATHVEEGEALLAFGNTLPPGSDPDLTLNLSQAGDMREAAANLYRHLRSLDAKNPTSICVSPLPEDGIGEAIHDRLRRAAAPRK